MTKPLTIRWRGPAGEPQSYPRRVWRSDWPEDAFLVVDSEQGFKEAITSIRASLVVREADDNGT